MSPVFSQLWARKGNERRVGGVGGDVGCRTRYANMAANNIRG